MAKTTKAKKEHFLTKENILEWYMDDVLEGKTPASPYLFAKNHGFTEPEFYNYFGSLEGIENHFFELIFDRTIETLEQSKPYSGYPAKEKLLSFYFTFFGNLTTNRSFVRQLLNPHKLESLRKLKGLHQRFVDYIGVLNFEKIEFKRERLNKLKNHAMEQGAWIQLLSVLKFWYRDESPGFEKTDIFIEKLLNVGFDLINVKPIKSVADLGKFIFKELIPAG